MRRFIVFATLAAYAAIALSGTAVATKLKCHKAPRSVATSIREQITDPTLGSATGFSHVFQEKAPSTGLGQAWFVAGRIAGSPYDGQVGVWARVVFRPGASGVYAAINDIARGVSDFGVDSPFADQLNADPGNYRRATTCAGR